MRGGLHDAACNTYRVNNVTDRRDRTGGARRAVHDRRVEFHVTGRVWRGPATRDVESADLHVGDSDFNDIECAGAACELPLTRLGQLTQMIFCGRVVVSATRAGATVQGQSKDLIADYLVS